MVLTGAGQEIQCQGQNLQWDLWDQAVSQDLCPSAQPVLKSLHGPPCGSRDEANGGLFGFWFFQSKNLPSVQKGTTNTEPHADAEKSESQQKETNF